MTKQHRATPEQWAQQALWVETYEDSSCIMELLHRVELLEATQHAHIDTSRPSRLTDAERKQIREDLARPAAWQPLKIATETTYGTAPIVVPNSPAGSLVKRIATDAELCQAYNAVYGFGPALRAVYDLGRQHGAAPIRSGPESPLVERVADAIAAQATSAGIVNDRPARAAILEVAAWLVKQAPEPGPVGKWLGEISTPFAVMADMLRDEANR